jgi:hypothetical protein
MIWSTILAAIFFLFNCTGEKVTVEPTHNGVLRYTLEASPTYRTRAPVDLHFVLTNLTDDTLHVLTWYTPFEGMKGDIFEVWRDSTQIRYGGRLVKRSEPKASDYIRIPPRGSVRCSIDLSQGYDVSAPGRYRVVYSREIPDVVTLGRQLPRLMNDHKPVKIAGNAVVFSVMGR